MLGQEAWTWRWSTWRLKQRSWMKSLGSECSKKRGLEHSATWTGGWRGEAPEEIEWGYGNKGKLPQGIVTKMSQKGMLMHCLPWWGCRTDHRVWEGTGRCYFHHQVGVAEGRGGGRTGSEIDHAGRRSCPGPRPSVGKLHRKWAASPRDSRMKDQ